MKDINILIDEVRQTQLEALRQANLLPRVKERVESAALKRRGRFGWLWLTVGVAGAATAAAIVLMRPVPLTVAVGDSRQPSGVGAVVEAPATAPLPLRFGDGTAVALAPNARVAVAAVDAHGATLVLEHGSLDVGVVHKRGARWSLRAGRFEVAVTGTWFEMSFDPASDALTVKMRAGSVLVRGPGLPGATPLRAGETLHAIGRTGRFDVAAAAGTAGAGAPATGALAAEQTAAAQQPGAAQDQAAPGEAPAPEAATAAGSGSAVGATPSFRITPPRAAPHTIDHRDRAWIELQQASRYREALAAAEHVGFSSLCARLDAGDLVALGDVARLAGNPTRAEEAYLAARRRYPRLDGPVFAMGLVAFEHRRRYNEAATWFAQYVESYPRGKLVTEAAGRLMESWQRAGKPDEAKKAALDYLEKYPSGAHAALARQIAGS